MGNRVVFQEEFNIKYPAKSPECVNTFNCEAFQSRRGKHFGMNRIYQKFPIIAQSSGFLIRDERKRVRRNIGPRCTDEISNVYSCAILSCLLKICIFNRLLSI